MYYGVFELSLPYKRGTDIAISSLFSLFYDWVRVLDR
jgi:hypothetical protein